MPYLLETIKCSMQHPRNRHKNGYDFVLLCAAHPPLKAFVFTNQYQTSTIDFSNPTAVKSLNYALLIQYYQITYWNIPEGYLCPPIPGRVDYIHYLADLLKTTNANKIPNGKIITVIDIGTGASCIYPILGQREYQWQFTATDIDPESIKTAKKIVLSNDNLAKNITCILQTDAELIFKNIILPDKQYDLTLCNPPFHRSLIEATQGTERKWKNLKKITDATKSPQKVKLNFGGQNAELWCAGGELAFIKKMINESIQYKLQVLWFTCLISKKEHVRPIKLALKKYNINEVKVINMAQGNKISRFVAWSYLDKSQQKDWCNNRF